MKPKDRLFQELERRTQGLEIEEAYAFSAKDLSDAVSISRNTGSQYLNELVKEGKCIKVQSRPVFFFAREVLEERWKVELSQVVFDSFEELLAKRVNDFESLVGFQGSLQRQIEQCKAAISYPGQGLPLLIHGPTGTGKTVLAGCMEQYARNHGILNGKSRMMSVNCSEYANNPELLTDNLFGHVKGAYTGAEEDSDGLISLADGGILFLDEVHCLKPECQEKLFQFMDKGVYHKVGDNDRWYKSKCRLIFATTEDPKNALLATLLRRIPIIITIPSLSDRPLVEKNELIFNILNREMKRLNRDIQITQSAYQALLDHEFKGNIGEMKNALKATCANVFVKQKEGALQIHLLDLPSYFFNETKSFTMKVYENEEGSIISVKDLKKSAVGSNPLLNLYDRLLETFLLYESQKEKGDVFIQRCHSYISSFIDFLFFKNKYNESNSSEEYLLKMVDKIYSIVINKYSLVISNSQIRIFSKMFVEYTKCARDTRIWADIHSEDVQRFREFLSEMNPRSYAISDEVIGNVALNLDIKMDPFMWVIITLVLVESSPQENNGRVGLILCHGYSTASSICDAANHMLQEHIFDGIDMELNMSIDKMVSLVNSYLKQKRPIQELIILVDMGSLEGIYEKIMPLSDCNIGLISQVSTASAIEVGNYIKQGKNVKEIIRLMQNKPHPSFRFIEGKKKPDAIFTLCATGFGAAKKISELILRSLPRPIDLRILPCDYKSLKEHGLSDVIFSDYNVKLLIGTLDPEIEDIPYMAVENIIMNEGIQGLNDLIGSYLTIKERKEFMENMMKNFTLSNMVNHLTILNPEKVMEDVEEIVDDLQTKLHEQLDPTKKVGLYIHLSCLIERLLLKQEIRYIPGIEEAKEKDKNRYRMVRESFSVVEMRYSVEIPDPEIMYILNYF